MVTVTHSRNFDINFRTPDNTESPQRGRERRDRDTTPVYEVRTVATTENTASGKS